MAGRKNAPEARRKADRCHRSWRTATSIRWTRSWSNAGGRSCVTPTTSRFFVASPRAAERVKTSVIAWIEKHLNVEVNRDKSGSGPSDQSGLLGFRLYADGRIGVAPKTITRLKAKVRELLEARQSLTSEQLRDQWQRSIRGWWHYFQLADWRRAVENLTGWTRRHMRKCCWLRWRHPRGRWNALKRLGARSRALGNAYCAKGAWAMARPPTLQQALKNATLHRDGFIIPWMPTPAPK